MSAETEAIEAFVPTGILSWLAPLEDDTAPSRRIESVVLFCDISGFTTIANRLVDQGREGLTTLRSALDSTFDSWITSIHANGGEVARFIGDAVVALWRVSDMEGFDPAIRSARSAAEAIIRSGHGSLSVAGVDVRGRCGVGVGMLDLASISTGVGQRELVISGKALSLATTAADSGEPGEVKLADGRSDSVAGINPYAHVADVVASHVPRPVRSRLKAGHAQWLGELRPISIMFVGLPQAQEAGEIQHAVTAVTGSIEAAEELLVKINVDDKGVVLMVVFGAPISHDDDAARAVAASITVSESLRSAGVEHSVGVASGRAFCGAIGNQVRRDYTVIGHATNLASRLMSLNGGVLIDQATSRLAGERFQVEDEREVNLKGIEGGVFAGHPVEAQATRSTTYETVVGRDHEKQQVDELINGAARVLIMEGEAGIGKSTLARYAESTANASDWLVIVGSAGTAGERQPLGVWQGALWSTFGQSTVRDTFDQLAKDSSWLTERRPLAAVFTAGDASDTALTQEMTGSVRAQNTWQIFNRLLEVLVAGKKTLLILEDAQWFDSASWALLESVMSTDLIDRYLLNMRPLDESPPSELRRMALAASTKQIGVGDMTRDDVTELLKSRFQVDYIPKDVLDRMVDGGSANPLFVEQLAYALVDAGQVEIEGRAMRAGMADFGKSLLLTGTIESILTSRIDQAPHDAQLTLKVASVIGREFALQTLEAIHPVAEVEKVDSDAAELEHEKLLRTVSKGSGHHYEFWHRLTRDVAYQLLPDNERAVLHEEIARWFEQHNRSVGSGVLAHHYLAAHKWSKAAIYLDRAALEAREANSNVEAVRELRVLRDLVEKGKAPARPGDMARWLRYEADALLALGRYDDARKRYKEALNIWQNPVSNSSVGMILGMITSSGSLLRNTPQLKDSAKREAATESALMLPFLSQMAYFDQKLLELLYNNVRAVRLASQSGDPRSLARAHGAWSIAASLSGLQGLSRKSNRKSLEEAERDGGIDTIAYASLLHGILHYARGNWSDAEKGFQRALDGYELLGATADTDTTHSAYAFLELFRGDVGKMLERADQTSANSRNQVRLWISAARIFASLMTDQEVSQNLLEDLEQTLQEPHLEKGDAILGWGVTAMVAAETEDTAKLDGALDAVSEWMAGFPAATAYAGFGLYGAALAGIAVSMDSKSEWNRSRAMKFARRSVRHLRVAGFQNPVIRPLGHLGAAQVARTSWSRSRHQRRATRTSEKLGTGYVGPLLAHAKRRLKTDPNNNQAEEAVA